MEETNATKTLEVGKYYRHAEGAYIAIRGRCLSTQWKECLIAESTDDQLGFVPVSPDRSHDWDSWFEVSEEEWQDQFVEKGTNE